MKNIQNFKSFVEVLESKKKINYDDINIDDYDYEKGEIVTLKHPTWREQYDFTVTVPGKNPTLRQIDGPREIILDRPKTFGLVAPKKLVDEYLEKNKKEKEIKPKSKKSMLTQREYDNLCKDMATSGLDDREGEPYNQSELMDMALDCVGSDMKLRNYLSKRLKTERPYDFDEYQPSNFDCAEMMADDMTQYD